VTDETPKKRTRPRAASPDAASGAGGAADPDAALRRLESMGATPAAEPDPGAFAEPDGGAFADPGPLPPAPVIDQFSAPSQGRPRRPAGGGSKRTPRSRPRPAGGSGSTRTLARVAAPVVFLIAVIALIGIVVNSGVMSSDQPSGTPTVKATKTTVVTRKYVVKTGDSLSSIADRFGTTTTDLQTLNPDLSGSTLVVGQKIVVPKP
jgi:LysM repeat protein